MGYPSETRIQPVRNDKTEKSVYCFSRILEEPVGFFFAGLPGEAPRAREDGVPLDRETLEFMRSYFSIEDPGLRKHIKTLLKTLSAPPKG
jgi:hypothetical protein